MAKGMKCPHCLLAIHAGGRDVPIGKDSETGWVLRVFECPACGKFILYLVHGHPHSASAGVPFSVSQVGAVLVRPRASGRAPCPSEVPPQIADDYKEACLVLADSPKASAALSRRCLQHVLRTAAGVKAGKLAGEIQQVLDSGKLASHLAEAIDAIRNIGNFAAHPEKSTATGEIVDVEPGEAEWNLDVLEQLFDHYYVAPAAAQKRRDALNEKLKAAGKPPMK